MLEEKIKNRLLKYKDMLNEEEVNFIEKNIDKVNVIYLIAMLDFIKLK